LVKIQPVKMVELTWQLETTWHQLNDLQQTDTAKHFKVITVSGTDKITVNLFRPENDTTAHGTKIATKSQQRRISIIPCMFYVRETDFIYSRRTT